MPIPDQIAEADAGAPAPRTNFPIRRLHIGGRETEPFGTHPHERLASRGRRLADLHAAARHAGAAGSRALVGRQRGVPLHEPDPVDADAKLLGGHLRDGDAQARAEIDLSAIERHAAILTQGEEGVDEAWVEHAIGLDGRSERLRERRVGRREADDQRASALQQGATREGSVHVRCLPVARITAFRTRSCVPQRQRLPESACLISSRLGLGFWAISAALAITMPLVQ